MNPEVPLKESTSCMVYRGHSISHSLLFCTSKKRLDHGSGLQQVSSWLAEVRNCHFNWRAGWRACSWRDGPSGTAVVQTQCTVAPLRATQSFKTGAVRFDAREGGRGIRKLFFAQRLLGLLNQIESCISGIPHKEPATAHQ